MSQRHVALIRSVVMTACILFLATAALGDEVRPGIHRLHGVYAVLPTDDLEPVAAVIGDAPVVALGESYHTSGGFYRLKYRIFRYLVEEKGFRAFAMESPWDYAESVVEYVETCEGSPEEALKGLFGVWQSESVRDLVRWMCVWNHRHPDDRVHFFGFDEQQAELDGPALKKHLERFGLKADDPRVQGIDRCDQNPRFQGLSDSDFNECMKRLDQLWNFFDRRERQIIRRTSAEELAWARIRLVGLRAWQYHHYRWSRARAYTARDEAMAHIFLAIRNLRFPGIKTVIWAHNGHIARKRNELSSFLPMGSFLADVLGDDYISLALIADEVGLDWPGLHCGTYDRPRWLNSVEDRLARLGEPYLFVDLDFPGTTSPFLEPGQLYGIGWTGSTVVCDQWDGIFYLDYSPPMVPLAWEPCQ